MKNKGEFLNVKVDAKFHMLQKMYLNVKMFSLLVIAFTMNF